MPPYYEEKIKEGKVIKVQDVAFITYVDPPLVPVADRPVQPVFKRFYSTCTPVVLCSHPSGPMPTARPGLPKSYLLPQIVFLDLRLNLSTALQIRYPLLHLKTQPPTHRGCTVRRPVTQARCLARDRTGTYTMRSRQRNLQQVCLRVCPTNHATVTAI